MAAYIITQLRKKSTEIFQYLQKFTWSIKPIKTHYIKGIYGSGGRAKKHGMFRRVPVLLFLAWRLFIKLVLTVLLNALAVSYTVL